MRGVSLLLMCLLMSGCLRTADDIREGLGACHWRAEQRSYTLSGHSGLQRTRIALDSPREGSPAWSMWALEDPKIVRFDLADDGALAVADDSMCDREADHWMICAEQGQGLSHTSMINGNYPSEIALHHGLQLGERIESPDRSKDLVVVQHGGRLIALFNHSPMASDGYSLHAWAPTLHSESTDLHLDLGELDVARRGDELCMVGRPREDGVSAKVRSFVAQIDADGRLVELAAHDTLDADAVCARPAIFALRDTWLMLCATATSMQALVSSDCRHWQRVDVPDERARDAELNGWPATPSITYGPRGGAVAAWTREDGVVIMQFDVDGRPVSSDVLTGAGRTFELDGGPAMGLDRARAAYLVAWLAAPNSGAYEFVEWTCEP